MRYAAKIKALTDVVARLKVPDRVEPWIAPELLAPAAMLELKQLTNAYFGSRRSDPVPCDIPDDILTEACGELNLLFANLLTDRDRLAGLLAPDVSLEDIIPCQRADQCPP